jgi:hypothetical protein
MKKLILFLGITLLAGSLFAQTENLNTITGFTEITEHTDNGTISLDQSDCNNELHINADADAVFFALPSARKGLTVAFYDDAGGVITVDTATGDLISLDGTDLDAGDSIDSSGAKGEAIVLIAIDATTWITWGPGNGTWVDAGP